MLRGPDGIVADMWAAMTSFLLGTVTLAVTTVLYVMLWRIEAPFWAWAVAHSASGSASRSSRAP